jgi:multidrug efflux pump subunit AcrB
LTIDDVSAALKAANVLAPAGRYTERGTQHLVLASGLWQSAADITNTPVVVKNGSTLRLGDIATVTPGAPDRTMLVVADGKDATTVAVSQQIGANILTVRAGVEGRSTTSSSGSRRV